MPDAPPIHRWPLLLLAIALLLAGCAPGPTGDRAPLPTLGPISERGGIKNKVLYQMTASTNCVSVGEPVTFTMTLINPSTVPITISTTPMVDFIIRPVSKAPDEQQATRIRRWSQAPDYPTIDPVIPAQQQRSFQWAWTAEPGFAVPDEYGVRVQFYTGAFQLDRDAMPPGGSELFLSVLAPPDPKQYHFSCEDLRPKP